eukprot:3006421-Pyramimonas_sp.AAC.1
MRQHPGGAAGLPAQVRGGRDQGAAAPAGGCAGACENVLIDKGDVMIEASTPVLPLVFGTTGASARKSGGLCISKAKRIRIDIKTDTDRHQNA